MSDVSGSKPRGAWPWLWGLWIAAFFAIEGYALATGEGGDTLTEQLQYVGGAGPWLFSAGVVLFASWLVVHFAGPDSRIWEWARKRREHKE